jgi:transcriptional regulator with XRE-family HTH domain
MLDENSISPQQCLGARAMLGLSRADLATLAKVAQATLADFEGGKRKPYARTLADIRGVLEARGATFVAEADKAGVLVPTR